jgi:hypothetical protein
MFRVVSSFTILGEYRRFRRTCCLHLQTENIGIESIGCHNPKDCNRIIFIVNLLKVFTNILLLTLSLYIISLLILFNDTVSATVVIEENVNMISE